MKATKLRLVRDIALVCSLIIVMCVAGWRLDNGLSARLADRVSHGVWTEASVLEVSEVWVPRGEADRVHIEYRFDGRTYRTVLMWLGNRADRDFRPGDGLEVYVDPDNPSEVATSTGAGSEGWLLMAPVHATAILVAMLMIVLIVRIQWYRSGHRRSRHAEGSN